MSNLPPLRKTVVVPLKPQEAFDLFIRRLPEWWPLTTRSATQGDAVSCHVEAFVGGRLYELTRQGRESPWGKFQVLDEPGRAVFTWHPGLPETASTEVEVTFTAVSAGTRVDLEHRNWERLGEQASFLRGLYENGGWEGVLSSFAATAAKT